MQYERDGVPGPGLFPPPIDEYGMYYSLYSLLTISFFFLPQQQRQLLNTFGKIRVICVSIPWIGGGPMSRFGWKLSKKFTHSALKSIPSVLLQCKDTVYGRPL